MLFRLFLSIGVLCPSLFAQGPKLATLGQYKNVTITKVEADGIRITHQDGVAKVPLEQIPKQMWKQLGLSADKAKEHREAVEAKATNDKEQEEEDQQRVAKKAAAGKPLKGKVIQVFTDGVFIEPLPFTKTVKKTELVRKYRIQNVGTALSGYSQEKVPYDVPELVERQETVPSWTTDELYAVVCSPGTFKVGDIGVADAAYQLGYYTYETKAGTTRTIPKLTISYERYLESIGETP
jgi:hypothetical protein